MLPHFLIIGAAKSGTTWLARHLALHPRLFVHPQEIHFFSRYHERGAAWYEAHFGAAKAGQQIGEKSNSYLADPRAAARIETLLPDTRLIALLRDPVERAYSGYCMHLARGEVSPEISLYLDPERACSGPSKPDFLGQGLYARNLGRYERYLAKGRLDAHTYEDLQEDPRRLLEAILTFLGVDPAAMPSATGDRINPRRSHSFPRPVAAAVSLFQYLPGARAAMAASLRVPAVRRIRSRLAFRRIAYPPLEPGLVARMRDYFRADIMALEALVDRDLSRWRS